MRGWTRLGSEDANARALQALGEVIASAPAGPVRDDATALFERALPTASQVGSLRPRATVILACDAAARAGMVDEVADVYQRVGERSVAVLRRLRSGYCLALAGGDRSPTRTSFRPRP